MELEIIKAEDADERNSPSKDNDVWDSYLESISNFIMTVRSGDLSGK